ncbi:hypothetical protein NW762_014647 [Fusarium torreyae]|uniref:Uncharacterized protein n=1 Tax=Fusarium torreyae TaxID=1237075 RepID=A0A9W8RL43_9HYPO|nr:hypothetical protein NW762_014647 [Fusarium torreyae]
METMSSYNPHIFKSINYLLDSDRLFHTNNGPAVRSGSMRDLFIKHGVVDGLGLILLHKHFEIGEDQALVDYNGTAMAWDLKGTAVSENGVVQKHGGFIKPRAWLLSTNKKQLIPYEFYFQHYKTTENIAYNQTALPRLTEEFVNEFAEILQRDNLTSVLGVCLLKSPLKTEVETSEGCANISVSVTDDAIFDSSSSIEAIWNYKVEKPNGDSPGVGFGSKFRCNYICLDITNGHIVGHLPPINS